MTQIGNKKRKILALNYKSLIFYGKASDNQIRTTDISCNDYKKSLNDAAP